MHTNNAGTALERFEPYKVSTVVYVYFALILVSTAVSSRSAAAANACTRLAVSALKQNSPTGYEAYRITSDKNVFDGFGSECADKEQFYSADVHTAVHETNHAIRAEKNAYHLVSNELLPVPPAPGYFAPSAIIPALAKDPVIRDDTFFKTYLGNKGQNANTSRDDFTYLLDEMNAYTNELQSQIDFAPKYPMTNRDAGVPAMMTFVAAYVKHARDHAPAVWMDLTASPASPTRIAVTKLWTQAEQTLRRACAVAPTSPNDMRAYAKSLSAASSISAISSVLGRQAQFPKECASDLEGPVHPSGESEMDEATALEIYVPPTKGGAGSAR